jgi:peptide deformylase
MSLPIVRYNNSLLRKKGAPVKVFDAALATLAGRMIETMHEAHGIGLAAQQIGRAIQLCVVDLREAELNFHWEIDGARPPLELIMPLVMANPVITVARGTKEVPSEEGCLSFPQIRGDVIRPDKISVKFQDERGIPHVLECDGLFSRCIQHEADHLNGILFIDRMEKKVRAGLDEAVKTLAKETREAAKSKTSS